MTLNDFAHIFYSNYSPSTDWEQLSEILWMYEEKLLSVERSSFLSIDEFHELIKKIENKRYKFVLESGDSIKHQALKLAASELLTDKFGVAKKDILYEESFMGFEVDVIDTFLTTPIECGDTNALKLEKYLSKDTIKRFIVLPYPISDSNSLYSFTFTPLPRFREYLDFKQKDSYKKLKTFHRRK